MRRALLANLTGHLLTYMTFKSRVQGFVLKLVGKALVGEKGHKASDAIGTLHFSHWVPFENNHMGFFTVFDGDWEEYIQDFATKPRSCSMRSFRMSLARRQPQSQRTPRRSISGYWTTTIRLSGFTAPIQASRFKTFEPCWPIASHNRPPLDSSGVT